MTITNCSFCKLHVNTTPTCLSKKIDGCWLAIKSVLKQQGILEVFKHENCGPLKKCANKSCKHPNPFSSGKGKLELDVHRGQEEETGRMIFWNYCCDKCVTDDGNSLAEYMQEWKKNLRLQEMQFGKDILRFYV